MNLEARDKWQAAMTKHEYELSQDGAQPQRQRSVDWVFVSFWIFALSLSIGMLWGLTMFVLALGRWVVARWFA